MDLEGKVLGNRYEIIEKIGNGGMAMVYKAKCRVLNRYVAIKILRDEFTTDDEFIKRFQVEAQSAASITHPNIVSIYDVGVDGNLHYIVMELIKGKTLKEIIVEEKRPLSWKWSIDIAGQIASALETAHKNKIVHRDIKPHNIIITEDGIAKVTDFGIAKAVSNSTITAFGSTIGSVHYFSPEHARGGFTDAKSDLYSLGVVMYEMLTGKVPFDADTPVSIALKHMQEEPKTAKEMNPNIPTAVNDIITKALKKDANLRYQSATAMLVDLKRALKEPEGNFVTNSNITNDFPTQRISTIGFGEDRGQKMDKEKNKKTNKFVLFIKKHKVLSSIVGLCLLFIISLGATIGIANASRPKEVAIPNLVGKTVEEVKQILAENKLNYVEDESEYNTEYEAGTVISQDPAFKDGRFIKENTDVKVVVSLGTEKTRVPKFKGMSKEEAEDAAKQAKLKLEIVEETSQTVQAGYIVTQETEADTEVNAGDTVKVYLSIGTGIEQVVVSSVLYKEEAVAKQTLEELGLVVEIEYDEDKERGNGVVLKQSIKSGETVDKGSTIVITVNKLAEVKECKVIVNVASLTNYKVQTEEVEGTDGEMIEQEIEAEDVAVTIYVDGSEYDTGTTKADDTSYTTTISGTGDVVVKVVLKPTSGNQVTKTKTVKLNTTSSVTFEK